MDFQCSVTYFTILFIYVFRTYITLDLIWIADTLKYMNMNMNVVFYFKIYAELL